MTTNLEENPVDIVFKQIEESGDRRMKRFENEEEEKSPERNMSGLKVSLRKQN